MQDDAFVVVFPSEFARPKMNQLVKNIKKNLRFKEHKFQSVKRDGDVIIVHANDPVFASSSINQLFGIKKIAIAKQIQNDLKSILAEITDLGGNLLLRGEKFLVKIEGDAMGFVPKDAEMAATSAIIEKKSHLQATPGSENKHDKLLYTYITKKFAYVCIFIDQGHKGVPNFSQNQTIICPVYDTVSAISCIEAIRQGFEVKIIVPYRKRSELNKIAKILSKVVIYTLQEIVHLEFYKFDSKQKVANQYDFVNATIQLCIKLSKSSNINRIAIPISNQIFPLEFTENISRFVTKSELIPYFPIHGLEDKIREMAREYVLEKYLQRIHIYGNFSDSLTQYKAPKTKDRHIVIKIGPTLTHDILDAIKDH